MLCSGFLGRRSSEVRDCGGSGGLMMVATAIYKVLGMKSGTVLIAAFAASMIDALPAVAGTERIAHVLVSKVTAAARMGRVLCAATRRVRRHHDGTARRCSLAGSMDELGPRQQMGQRDDQTADRS